MNESKQAVVLDVKNPTCYFAEIVGKGVGTIMILATKFGADHRWNVLGLTIGHKTGYHLLQAPISNVGGSASAGADKAISTKFVSGIITTCGETS